MKKTTEIKYQLNEREMWLVKKCVDYSWHRWEKHKESGIRKAIKEIDLVVLKNDMDRIINTEEVILPPEFGKMKAIEDYYNSLEKP